MEEMWLLLLDAALSVKEKAESQKETSSDSCCTCLQGEGKLCGWGGVQKRNPGDWRQAAHGPVFMKGLSFLSMSC